METVRCSRRKTESMLLRDFQVMDQAQRCSHMETYPSACHDQHVSEFLTHSTILPGRRFIRL